MLFPFFSRGKKKHENAMYCDVEPKCSGLQTIPVCALCHYIFFRILLVPNNSEHLNSPDDTIKTWSVASRGFKNTISLMGRQ